MAANCQQIGRTRRRISRSPVAAGAPPRSAPSPKSGLGLAKLSVGTGTHRGTSPVRLRPFRATGIISLPVGVKWQRHECAQQCVQLVQGRSRSRRTL